MLWVKRGGDSEHPSEKHRVRRDIKIEVRQAVGQNGRDRPQAGEGE